MDIRPVGTAVLNEPCGDLPCGQCAPCRRKAQLMAASFVARNAKKDAPQGALLDLLEHLGLTD